MGWEETFHLFCISFTPFLTLGLGTGGGAWRWRLQLLGVLVPTQPPSHQPILFSERHWATGSQGHFQTGPASGAAPAAYTQKLL